MRKNKGLPFILRFAEKGEKNKTEESYKELLFYDEEESLTMVMRQDSKIPFIRANENITEIATKTKKEREGDDFNPCSMEIEMRTKTFKKREGDDFSENLNLS